MPTTFAQYYLYIGNYYKYWFVKHYIICH